MNVVARRKRQRRSPPPSRDWCSRRLSLPHIMSIVSSSSYYYYYSLEWWWTITTTDTNSNTSSSRTSPYDDQLWLYPITTTTSVRLTPPPPPPHQWMPQLWPRRRCRSSRIVGMTTIIILLIIIQACSSSVPFPSSSSSSSSWSRVVSAYTIHPISSSWKQRVVMSFPPPPQFHSVRLFSSHQNDNTPQNDRSNSNSNNNRNNNGGQSRPKRTPSSSSSSSSSSSGSTQKSKTTTYNNNNNNNRNGPRNYKNNSTSINNNNSATKNPKYSNNSSTKSGKWNTTTTSKQELVKAVGKSIQATRQKQQQQKRTPSSSSSTSTTTTPDQLWNPYQAGQKLRQSIETTITSIQALQTDKLLKQSPYYIDDRFMDRVGTSSSGSSSSSSSSVYQRPSLPWDDDSSTTTFIPEILVVGATGRLGRLIVRQLLLLSQQPNRTPVRVRVLVRDLYTRTLDILGTGVTYCQGDLLKMETLEDAVTDIDKLVFVASSSSSSSLLASTTDNDATGRTEEEREQQYRQKRIQMAEQIDVIGMSNLISAYQNVRHADYGTSQAAKRSLFKFQDRRREDFSLFSIEDDDDDDDNVVDGSTQTDTDTMSSSDDVAKSGMESMSTFSKRHSENKPIVSTTSYDDDFDDYEDTYENLMNAYDSVDTYDKDEEVYNDKYNDYNGDESNYEDYATSLNDIEKRNDASVVKTQSRWIRNSFGHGVFVGRIPRTSQGVNGGSNNSVIGGGGGGEAAIICSRLRSRDDPEMGIALGPNFAGFISRICSDGNTYEAFVRTGSYATNGIEYVCEFSTSTKGKSSSRNKFLSVRLPFSSFKPVQRKTVPRDTSDDDTFVVPPFRGNDVRHIGFRYRCCTTIDDDNHKNSRYSNTDTRRIDRKSGIEWNRFYLAFSYIKVYRSQPEPEFVYVSDARIPPIVRSNMVEDELKQILPYSEASLQTLSNRNNDEGPNILQIGTEIRLELQNSQTTTIDGARKVSAASQHNFVDTNRIPEETYYKYRGEELLKKSGLSYAIVRVGELCDSPASLDDMNDIVLSPSTSADSVDDKVGVEKQDPLKSKEQAAISRADIAHICVQALLDPNALNKSFNVHRRDTTSLLSKESISNKLAAIPTDSTP